MSKPFAEAADRNSRPIADVLRFEFADCDSILEIGSGTGQHAVYLGRELPHLVWQTSDVNENLAGIRAWIAQAGLRNVLEPLEVDVRLVTRPDGEFDGIFSSNTAHIMHVEAVRCMFELAGSVLPENGVFALYGPVRRRGGYNTESNAVFDESLRRRDPGMGLRDLEWLDELAATHGLHRTRLYAMPANNHVAVWVKAGDTQ
ncbi:MAG: DUF938 domain-containing protein [Woeseiaceae bacterium]|nr:DUF938 domain-containing protein [Woeseiaceae bacterium]NIP20170.1 DUF938 domain-containing protein [Woeseiaceae bacterium]NIS88966.1 DUF938 domain-containing protein [Woeseiaceae bacterium]